MKHGKRIAAVGALALSLTPVWSQAASEAQALDACVRAMTNAIEEDNGAPIDYQVESPSIESSQKLRTHAVFHLDADDAKSGKVVARVDCFVNEDAEVIRMRELSLKAKSAKRRSKFTT
jgi:hypothetical protein